MDPENEPGNSRLSAFEGRREELDIKEGEILPEFRLSENCSCSSDASTERDGEREACAIAVPESDKKRIGNTINYRIGFGPFFLRLKVLEKI